ncbi:U-box domain-containing protein 43 [Triticum urartu]|uniref:RING-type E3 ubiquitin transferase n=2 Tax=Triticum urartu TaxID=4572 RepID=M7YEZ1_TRIUA|nr:U-box domain-containing protein 44-like isoform X1 [Triticum urartu]XP_048551624.1 U-box domain-containing protein 44-like isoform X1 [Triticum urartu]EMS45692.1 U-box domain-containing protein 43 [Triticum urartu]
MADVQDGHYDSSTDSLRVEPIYESFLCPLTKQIMRDPVTLESGATFEREAILKWFQESDSSGRSLVCPITRKELSSTEFNPSIALRNTIDEWMHRNEAAKLDVARKSLTSENSEHDTLQALEYVVEICQRSRSSRHVVRKLGLISLISELLKNSSTKVRQKSLESLCFVAKDDNDNKDEIAAGDNIRTIVKFLSHGHVQEKEQAASLLYELSQYKPLSEKIGSVPGAILILVGLSSSKIENLLTVDRADKTLVNLESCEKNVRQMAENGRLQPLLRLLLEGSADTQLSMAAYVGELVLTNEVKVFVAQTAGSALVNIMKSGNREAREAALKALNQISSYDVSAKILIEAGILPPLIADLFTVGSNQLPMRLKKVSATILANVVASGANFQSIPLDHNRQTLVSEEIVHNLLHLISNTGPATECKLLQVLVGLTSSSTTVQGIVDAIKSSGATVSLIQFIEAPQREVRMASIKLLNNISPCMGQELAEAFRGNFSQLSSLIRVIADNNGISEEQAPAAGLVADLPLQDSVLTRRLVEDGAFTTIISKVIMIRQGESRGGRFVNPFLEGLVRIVSRITFILEDDPDIIAVAREYNLTALFSDLLQMNGLDTVQIVSATALGNLSGQSKHLTKILPPPNGGLCFSIFPCLSQKSVETGVCRVHHGICSSRESFCLLEGKVVEKLVACLDHNNEKVVEASLTALSTLLDDGVDIDQGVMVLCDAEGVKPILDVLCENRTEALRQRAVWAVERILRTDEIAYEISGNQNVSTALVEAFRHGDFRTRQIAERALKHVDKLPNFSGIFSKIGAQ